MQITKNYLSSYILGKTIGKGTFGKVKLALHKITNEPVAIKILQKDKIKDVTDVQRVSRQLHILKTTRHSSIAQMYEIVQTTANIFIIMEYAKHGQFFDFVMDGKIKNQDEAHHYFVQIISGLQYLHSLKICHRDVKPENMLLDYKKRLKIVDFGLSNMYKKGQYLLTACGSPCYASPEMIKGEEYDPQLTDVWSLGVVLFSMVLSKLPFEDQNTSILYSKIKSGLFVIDKKISSDLKDLLSRMLCVNPQNRFNLKQIKQHTWYKNRTGLKCFGIQIGYQNLPFDEGVLRQLQQLGYKVQVLKKYLENNIRNQGTTAYWLLLKKHFKNNSPSLFDICHQNFNQKNLIQKVNNFNIKFKQGIKSQRHKSFDFSELTKNQHKNFTAQQKIAHRDQRRNCISQMKPYDNIKMAEKNKKLQRGQSTLSKSSHYHQAIISENNRKKHIMTKSIQKNCLYNSSAQKSYQIRNKRIHSKNIEKQDNISINIFIHNSSRRSKSRNKERLQTMNDERSTPYCEKLIFTRKRLKSQETQKYDRNKKYDPNQRTLNKSLKKSSHVHHLQNSFWKKKSLNFQSNNYSTEVKNKNRRYKN